MGYDRISALPDSLITQILLCLPTRDSVKTSVLSSRWRNLWFDVPGLKLHSKDFPSKSEATTKKFIERFLEFNRQSRLQKFKLVNDCLRFIVRRDIMKEWIAIAVDRGVEDLNVKTNNGMYGKVFIPMNIYKSKTLVSLTLARVGLENPEFVVSLPCLKIMHLEDICNNRDGLLIMEKLISGCAVLGDLTLVRNHYDYLETRLLLRVRSQSLKIFRLTFNWEAVHSYLSVEIDAPGLKYLSFRDSQHARIVVKNLNSLSKIDIDTKFNSLLTKRDINHDFLNGIYSVNDMIISQSTLEVLYRYSPLGLPIPKFHNLSHLHAAFSSSLLKFLPIFLDSFPNLKNLILDFSVSTEPKQIDLTYVPRCLSSTLKYVEINELIMWEKHGIKLVRYILENSAVLMKLNLSFTSTEALDIYEELLTSVKHSRRCKINLFY